MSLFGDDSDLPAARQKSSLFDDENETSGASRTKNTSSIFADTAESTVDDSSPWGFTPKKAAGRGNLVRTLLAEVEVPDSYIDAFDSLQSGGYVSAQDTQLLVRESRIPAGEQSKLWSIIGEGTTLGRGEFNVLIALIGLAQEGEELGLDAVDERRKNLPIASLPTMAQTARNLPETSSQNTNTINVAVQQESGLRAQSDTRQTSFGASFGDDPWGSPAAGRNGSYNGINSSTQRTTSTFTTGTTEQSESVNGGGGGGYGNTQTTGGASASSWGQSSTFGGGAAGGFGTTGAEGGGGFGDDGNDNSGPSRPPPQPRASTSKGAEESITVQLLDEKEGMFMFQHRNYEVASVRRNSKVIRRYSDFVWLLDCLHKRYPFRQLPLLPPKRVAINGNHLATDALFVEKRRRGLVRFANALVRHPILREEQLVVMFLTVPTELAVWRKQATISVQEEFVGKALPPTLEDSLPQNLQETFDTVRSGVRRSADLYINLCSVVERLCKRKDGIAAEFGRANMNLNSVLETSNDTFAIDTNDVPLLNEGINATAKHISVSKALLEDEARAWDQGVLEDFKTIRDSLVSMRDLFDRRDKYAKDNIPQLERRIQNNEQKLQGIKAKGDAAKPGEAEKVENAIINDKQSIVNQHARGVFIKECVRDELLHFQNLQYRVSKLHQDWAQERVKYAELQADNVRTLVDAVESMPQGD